MSAILSSASAHPRTSRDGRREAEAAAIERGELLACTSRGTLFRSLPCNPLASASLEHSCERASMAALSGLAIMRRRTGRRGAGGGSGGVCRQRRAGREQAEAERGREDRRSSWVQIFPNERHPRSRIVTQSRRLARLICDSRRRFAQGRSNAAALPSGGKEKSRFSVRETALPLSRPSSNRCNSRETSATRGTPARGRCSRP